jgi:hypothetical protein
LKERREKKNQKTPMGYFRNYIDIIKKGKGK